MRLTARLIAYVLLGVVVFLTLGRSLRVPLQELVLAQGLLTAQNCSDA